MATKTSLLLLFICSIFLAARRAKYSPATICGRPVKVSGAVTYTFVLN